MCTLNCLSCVFTFCICICIQSGSFKDFVVIWIYLSNCLIIDFADKLGHCAFFWYWKCIPGISILITKNCSCSSVTVTAWSRKSINILKFKICAWFRFSIWFWRLIATKPGYTEPISPSQVKEGKTKCFGIFSILLPLKRQSHQIFRVLFWPVWISLEQKGSHWWF